MSHVRAIGPVGSAARLAIGVLAIVVAVAAEGIGWWDVAAVLTVTPLITDAAAVVVNTALGQWAPDLRARTRAPWSAAQLAASSSPSRT
ncbi:MAG: hypothetical protein ACRDWI_05995 [Jiangellaceae bacterium]